jgi:lipopolysaccharide biosynthesis glycosyltransferase
MRDEHNRLVGLGVPAPVVGALIRGQPLERAVTRHVRARLRTRAPGLVEPLCEALAANPRTSVAGDLGKALVARTRDVPKKAWYQFGRVPYEDWRRWAPAEYVETAREIGSEEVVAAANRLLDDRPQDVPPNGWLALGEVTFSVRRFDLSRQAQELAAAAVGRARAVPEPLQARVAWLDRWLTYVEADRRPPDRADGLAFGLLHYQQPDLTRTPGTLDDYLTTLACLGLLVRQGGVDLAGPPDLVELARSLRGVVDGRQTVDGIERPVTLVPVSRDANSLDAVPDPTWVLAAGEFIESWFGNVDLPFNPAIRPIFISFHCTKSTELTAEAIAYLRRHGPIGCRDWTTVYVLHGAGVPCFFSGCVTSTLDTLVAREGRDAAPSRSLSWDDEVTEAKARVTTACLATNLADALRLLGQVSATRSRVVTGSLPAYLSARAVGARARFKPDNPADVRFNGLIGLTDAAFEAMRVAIADKLASTLSLILSGAGEDEVYGHWRSICASEVEAARARIADVAPLRPPAIDVAATCRRIRAERVDRGPGADSRAVDVTVALDGNLKRQLGVVLEALTTNGTRPLHVWVQCRDHGPDDYDRMARAFSEVTFTWLPCDGVDYGDVQGMQSMLKHITAATLDRLLLPELLVELDRVVYLDLDTLPVGDVAELYDWDLVGSALAARTTPFMKTGYANVLKLAETQRRAPAAGDWLVRWMAATHPYDFDRFNAGVLVLDLARMRRDEFTRKFIPFVECYGFNDQIVLNLYTGANHVPLPSAWNHQPSQEWLESPKLVHWAGPLKPWNQPMVPLADWWRKYEAAYDSRVAAVSALR